MSNQSINCPRCGHPGTKNGYPVSHLTSPSPGVFETTKITQRYRCSQGCKELVSQSRQGKKPYYLFLGWDVDHQTLNGVEKNLSKRA